MIVIGATDGTLTFLTLDAVNNRLVRRSTNTQVHKDCINAIWCEKENPWSHEPFITYIASNDRIVSSWSCVNDEPVLNQTIVFPESILFVCDYADKYVLAAGKRMLYIAEIETNKIIRELEVNDNITGLHSTSHQTVLTTASSTYYISSKDLPSEDVPFITTNTPNLWISPDGSLGVIVQHYEVEIFDVIENTELYFFDDRGPYDIRPHLSRFSPMRYWLTVSTGPSLITYDLESKLTLALVSPRISRKEFDGGLPKCNAFWYSKCGHYLFGLYSNNALFWWHLLF